MLKELLPALSDRTLELVGLSGTSGGALSALTARYGVLEADAGIVPDRLDSLWADIAAHSPGDRLVNPQTRVGEPTTLVDIADRRNELSGNLWLNQELRFGETVNRWVAAGHLPEDQYNHTDVRRIQLGRELSCSSKFDRTPTFLEGLIDSGEERAAEFLAGLP